MHDLDLALILALEGKHDAAMNISDNLEKKGFGNIPRVSYSQTDDDIWLRHSFNRGWHFLRLGKLNEGMKLLESGRYLNTYGGPQLSSIKPIWNPELHATENKKIVLCLEGGYGDEIIFARFATQLKNKGFDKVYVVTVDELKPIFSRIEGCDGVFNRLEIKDIDYDYWMPGFSSAWVCGFDYNTLPSNRYLTPHADSKLVWSKLLKTDKKYKVGIRWAGNPKFEHQQFRTFPSSFMTQMAAAFPNVQFYSFQRDENLVDLPDSIIDLQHMLISWEDTAAALDEMDLVISSCTSIAHMSAALGKDTFVVIPVLPYYIWAYGTPSNPGEKGISTSPWYKSVTLFRQQYKGKWNDPFQDLYNAIECKFGIERECELLNHDEEIKRLNMGCGFKKLDGFINADRSSICSPDVIVDFSKHYWDEFKDNEFNHIVAKDILEHLPGDFCQVIKEMYRISKNGAIWEIQFPHHRCDHAYDDPTHVRVLTQKTFKMFDRVEIQRMHKDGMSESRLAFEHGVDIQVCEVQYDFIDYWTKKVQNKEMTVEELYEALSFYNNVATSVKLLIQVHKPVRVQTLE
ncbi:hypothetical protein [Synechococcus phage BUCT-ZZ01]|nr:hypothetical protein [Synechococcus phage BUCT-ZZ01]